MVLAGVLIFPENLSLYREGFLGSARLISSIISLTTTRLKASILRLSNKQRMKSIVTLAIMLYLKDVTSYMSAKGSDSFEVSWSEPNRPFLELAEKDRQSEVRKLLDEIDNRINQYNFYLARSGSIMKRPLRISSSQTEFIRSSKAIMVHRRARYKTLRLETAKDNPELMKSILTGKDEYSSDIIPEFKGNPK